MGAHSLRLKKDYDFGQSGGSRVERDIGMTMSVQSQPEVEFSATDAECDIVQRVRSLCPPPEVALSVIEMARDPDVDLGRLSRLIELDPTLTAQLLRTVNSARFGLSARVKTVSNAVSLVGLKSLRMLATAFGMLNPFSARLPHAIYQRYWRKSLTVALLARELASTSTDDACTAFTTGLVSDIGVLVLAQVDGPPYHKVYQQLQTAPKELLAAEKTRFGTDHYRVGGLTLRQFALDPQVVQAVLSLSELESSLPCSSSLLTRQLQMAHELSERLVQGDREQWDQMQVRLLEDFQIDTDKLVSLMSRIATELHEWGEQFQLNVPQIDEARFREVAAAALVDLSIAGAIDLSIFQSVFGPCDGAARPSGKHVQQAASAPILLKS
jgi:HD-like signal output (HDOD) protein